MRQMKLRVTIAAKMVGQFTTDRQQAGHTGRVSNVFPAHGQSLGITTTSDLDLDSDNLPFTSFILFPMPLLLEPLRVIEGYGYRSAAGLVPSVGSALGGLGVEPRGPGRRNALTGMIFTDSDIEGK